MQFTSNQRLIINMIRCLIIVAILQSVYYYRAIAEDVPTSDSAENGTQDNDLIVLNLDENMNRILYDLFIEIFGNNNSNNKIELPVQTVAEIYSNYTQEQLELLKSELKQFDDRFDIVRKRVDSLQQRFLVSNIAYALNHDLTQYEKHFIQIGEEVITLQKLILKYNNSKPVEELPNNERSGRKSTVSTIFDRLAALLLGINTGPDYQQSIRDTLGSTQVNRLITLMRALQSLKNVPPNTTRVNSRSNLIKLQTMLYRLQQVQELNRLANTITYHKSRDLNPYRYEAILNLVRLVGTSSGSNQLRSILNMFANPTTNRVKNRNNLSPEKLKAVIRAIEDQENRRKEDIESKRQKEVLSELLRNQNRQQEQISQLIKLIERQNKVNEQITTITAQTPTQDPPTTLSSNQTDLVEKLREQRRHLKELLRSLGQNNFGPTNDSIPGVPPVRPPIPNPEIQQKFSRIIQTIGPMIGALAQSGLLTPQQNQFTQNSLFDLLKRANRPNIHYDSYKSIIERALDLLYSLFRF